MRSFSQLSTIIAAPAKQNPDSARRGIQAVGVMKISDSSIATAAKAAITPKARIWPASATRRGVATQPEI